MDEKFIEPIMKDFVDAHYPLYNAFSGQTFVRDDEEFLRLELLVKVPRTGQVYAKGVMLACPASADDVMGACRGLARSLRRTMVYMAVKHFSEEPDVFDKARDFSVHVRFRIERMKRFIGRVVEAWKVATEKLKGGNERGEVSEQYKTMAD